MKVVILAGGLGTRISEESHLKPKPMIEIGKYPILVHIMRIYASQGFNDFIVCAGYKQQVIKEYFSNFDLYTNDITFNFLNGERKFYNKPKFDWRVTIADTGLKTQTGGRVAKVKKYLNDNEDLFMLTYGDAVGDIDINKVLESHIKSGKLATICVYNFGQSKGVVELGENNVVKQFREKSDLDGDLINIGFMILNKKVLSYIEGSESILEKDVLSKLARQGELNAYLHKGFWQCMDTLREKELLEKIYNSDNCPWKIWEK